MNRAEAIAPERPAVVTDLLAVDHTGVVANYIRRLETSIETWRAGAPVTHVASAADLLDHRLFEGVAYKREKRLRIAAEQQVAILREALAHAHICEHIGTSFECPHAGEKEGAGE